MTLKNKDIAVFVGLPLSILIAMYFVWQIGMVSTLALPAGPLAAGGFALAFFALTIICGITSAAHVIGKILDLFTKTGKINAETVFSMIGFGTGLSLGLTMWNAGHAFPLAATVHPALAAALFIVVAAGVAAKCFSWLGQAVDAIIGTDSSLDNGEPMYDYPPSPKSSPSLDRSNSPSPQPHSDNDEECSSGDEKDWRNNKAPAANDNDWKNARDAREHSNIPAPTPQRALFPTGPN